jgi:hypothetical protein
MRRSLDWRTGLVLGLVVLACVPWALTFWAPPPSWRGP